MDSPYFLAPAWNQALTLTERVAGLRTAPRTASNSTGHADLAARRLELWKSQSPFPTEPYFAQRLALDGITEEELLACLGEPPPAGNAPASSPPGWWVDLASAFAHPAPDDTPSPPLPETPRAQELAGFLLALEPLLSRARERLHAGVEELSRAATRLPSTPTPSRRCFLPTSPGRCS